MITGKAKYILLFFLVVAGVVMAQQSNQKAKLQSQYNQIVNEIKNIEDLLKKTKSEKEQSLVQIQSLAQKISARQSLINNINSQVQFLQNSINENQKVIKSMEDDLEALKKSYAEIIYNSYKGLGAKNRMSFVFSSENFNQATQRFSYLRTYSKYRQNQALLIRKTIADLNEKLAKLEEEKKEKQKLLDEEKYQAGVLVSEKSQKDELVKKLQQDEANLLKQAKEKNEAAQNLNKQIQKIIEEEIRLAKEKAAKEAKAAGKAAPKAGELALTPEEKQLSASFVSNKGKLPWPVVKGHIIERFGNHPHPTLKGVIINNNGVDIKTENDADVRAVFAGSVVSSFYLPTTQNSVIVKHGEYFTVYSHLKSVNVKPGDNVSTKQTIGKVYTNSADGVAKVHLEVWKGTEKTNPELWLSK
jgi:murein hydrolase activator